LAFTDADLGDRSGKDHLRRGVEPYRRQRADDRLPDPLLVSIEPSRRRRSLAWQSRRDNRQRDTGFPAARHP
jgi:hypothetical protein